MSKFSNLQELRKQMNLEVKGLDNFPLDCNSLIVSNHACFMDIFYVPSALPVEVVEILSSRAVFKPVIERKETIKKFLNVIPLEMQGGSDYSNVGIKYATELLSGGLNLVIFPEGVYDPGKDVVYRGRTGAARILLNAREKTNRKINLVPVSINIKNEVLDVNSYKTLDNVVSVNILPSINYEDEFNRFTSANCSRDEANDILHSITDKAMSVIAKDLGQEYKEDYRTLEPKNAVVFDDGSSLPKEEAKDSIYLELYDGMIDRYTKGMLISRLSSNISPKEDLER